MDGFLFIPYYFLNQIKKPLQIHNEENVTFFSFEIEYIIYDTVDNR
jgi:hypothetical protein